MATIQQIQTGMAKFVDHHIAGAYSGIDKVIVLGGCTLLASSFPNIVKMYANHPVVAALGVYNADSGTVDIDSIYNAFVPHMGQEKIPITLPKMGKIDLGTIKLGKEEIDILYRYIKEG